MKLLFVFMLYLLGVSMTLGFIDECNAIDDPDIHIPTWWAGVFPLFYLKMWWYYRNEKEE